MYNNDKTFTLPNGYLIDHASKLTDLENITFLASHVNGENVIETLCES